MYHFPRVLPALALAACAVGPASAQQGASAGAAHLCQSPPLTQGAMDRLRRLPDYPRMLDMMAADCPQVAMLFAMFVVGEVDRAAHQGRVRNPPDYLPLIGPDRLFRCCDVASVP